MSKPAVLIVDDQPNWRELLFDLLAGEYEVVSVGSYEEALQKLDRGSSFHVAVVDIRLNDKDRTNEDGLRLLERLKEQGTSSIIVTGYPSTRTTKEALRLGAFEYLEKYPEDGMVFDPGRFREIVRNAVDDAKKQQEQYADFALHIGSDGHARAVSEQGERRAKISLDIPTEVDLMSELIEQGQTTEELLKKFGQRLYEILFPPRIDTHLNATEAAAPGRKIRIRLTISNSLAQLPWEFLYREERGYFLATNPDTVLSHYLDLPLPPGYVRQREGPLHMLTIISNPKDQPQLDVERWDQIVREALSKPLGEGQLTLQTVRQATFENIEAALLKPPPPDIVQFVGHGVYRKGKGYLALVGESGETWIVDDERFAAIFAGVQDRLGLVCLATCESAKSDSPQSFLGIAPQIVQRGVPAVVAMRYPVCVSTAEIFLESFYKAVAARKPVDWAVQWARNAISIQVGLNNRDFATPVLFMRAKDGNIF